MLSVPTNTAIYGRCDALCDGFIDIWICCYSSEFLFLLWCNRSKGATPLAFCVNLNANHTNVWITDSNGYFILPCPLWVTEREREREKSMTSKLKLREFLGVSPPQPRTKVLDQYIVLRAQIAFDN